MGGNMAQRLIQGGHQVVGHDRAQTNIDALVKAGGVGALSLSELVLKLKAPRVVWVMVPAGTATEETVAALGALLSPGDAIVDGGNSYFKDDVRRAETLKPKGIHYLDVGTSGGVFGLTRGYCLMIGGPQEAVTRLSPIFQTLAPGQGSLAASPHRDNRHSSAEEGYLHCGKAGSGHFVKMVHNGIEYGMMQAYAEGFDLMRSAAQANLPEAQQFELPLADIAELWRRGSVIPSWLLDLIAASLAQNEQLTGFTGRVEDSGEGRWTVQTAIEEAVAAPVLTEALFARFRSRQENTFGEKLLSAMRAQFGGHGEAPKK